MTQLEHQSLSSSIHSQVCIYIVHQLVVRLVRPFNFITVERLLLVLDLTSGKRMYGERKKHQCWLGV